MVGWLLPWHGTATEVWQSTTVAWHGRISRLDILPWLATVTQYFFLSVAEEQVRMLPKPTPKSKSGGRCGASEASRSSPPDLLFGVGLCVASRSWDQYPDDFFDLLFGMGLCVLSRSWDQYPDELSDFFLLLLGEGSFITNHVLPGQTQTLWSGGG
jgi:hypothetical protein